MLDKAGEVVSKDELIAKAWPDVTVEEGQPSRPSVGAAQGAGRRTVRNKYIENVQGRGYSFVVPISAKLTITIRATHFRGLLICRHALSRMIGRDDAVLDIRTMLKSQPLTTILGAGGIGKTTVALAVGHAALADFSGQVFFVDLSAVRDREQVIGAIATAIGLESAVC